MEFKVALLQITPSGNDPDSNLAKALYYCQKAKSEGADLAVLPELWSIGCAPCPWDEEEQRLWIAQSINRNSSFFQNFRAAAKELSMGIAVTYLESHLPKPRNTVSIINSQGEAVLNYSKVFICDFGGEELSKPNPDPAKIGCDVHCSPGNSFGVCTLTNAQGSVQVGAMICADREFPEAATQLMRNGAELIVIPNACTWDDLRSAGLKTRAFENLVGVAMANYPGPHSGHSQAYTCVAWDEKGQPQNMLIASADEQEQMLLATFNLDAIRAFRKMESWRFNYRQQMLVQI